MSTRTEGVVSGIRYLKGVGPKRALALEKLGIHSLRDLLYFFPRRYEDRSRFKTIAELTVGETASVRGEVLKVNLRPLRGRASLLELAVGDETGVIYAVWFNQPYLKKYFSDGQKIILYGRIDFYENRIQVNSPEHEILEPEEESVHTGRITPVYPLTEGLFQRSLRAMLKEILDFHLAGAVQEYLPLSFRSEKNLMELREAIHEMHFPAAFEKQAEARRRLVFDEFLIFQFALFRKIETMRTRYKARAFSDTGHWIDVFKNSLPFTLTASQEQAIREISKDLAQTFPMNRLLQGDVGSGKTIVAAFSLLAAAKNNHQAALLVPTEILAEQHFRTLQNLLASFDLQIGLLSSSTPAAKRERILAELRQGKLQIIVGTHSLLEEDIQFGSLGLVVVDEQHKFGVYQRSRLLNADPRPHHLVMTATPIPRTLALTIYGDLSNSIMRELPAGRKPIKTFWITRQKQADVLKHLLEKMKEGTQAYFIFPVIEETEKSDLLAATKEYERLRKGIFAGIRMGLIHGRLAHEEKESVMRAFNRGEIQALIATSVIEVGINNPNADLMVIENAERFGLAQLHQMRGRIGRGVREAECFLFGEPKTVEGQKRLRILTKTQDGFVIAEEDLKLRGPGDFWGTRQSGEPLFKIADPLADQEILLEARQTAADLMRGEIFVPAEKSQIKNFLEQIPIRY